MDWARAIERNRDALNAILAALFAMLGLQAGGTVERIPRHLHRAVLRVLRPAESAARRLIVIAARGLVAKPAPARPMPVGGIVGRGGATRPSFQLFDPRKRFAHERRTCGPRSIPRIHIFGADPRLSPLWSMSQPAADPAPPPDDDRVDAGRLCRRLDALKLALADLPRQAKRLVRWQAKREKMPSAKFTSPLRIGPPPGRRRKSSHEVDKVLAECHGLARDAMSLDTS